MVVHVRHSSSNNSVILLRVSVPQLHQRLVKDPFGQRANVDLVTSRYYVDFFRRKVFVVQERALFCLQSCSSRHPTLSPPLKSCAIRASVTYVRQCSPEELSTLHIATFLPPVLVLPPSCLDAVGCSSYRFRGITQTLVGKRLGGDLCCCSQGWKDNKDKCKLTTHIRFAVHFLSLRGDQRP